MTFFPILGQYEVWQFINLTGDTHPMHIHLNPFQILARRRSRVDRPRRRHRRPDHAATVPLGRGPDDKLDHALDANERGLKDTIRVNPNEIVELAVRFETYSGRYMYHCHILEHEDRDMMRPIVIMPAELMPVELTAPTSRRRGQLLSPYRRRPALAPGTRRLRGKLDAESELPLHILR